MDRVSIKTLVIVLGIAELYLGVVPQASACCLTDWMFRRRQTPVTANYGAAPAYPPPVSSAPVTPAYPAPVAPAAPTPPVAAVPVNVKRPSCATFRKWPIAPSGSRCRSRLTGGRSATTRPRDCRSPARSHARLTPIRRGACPTPVSDRCIRRCRSARRRRRSRRRRSRPQGAIAVRRRRCRPMDRIRRLAVRIGAPPAGVPTGVPSGAPTSADPPGATPWQPVGPAAAAPSSGSEWTPAYNGSTTTPDPADQKPRIDPDVNNGLSAVRRPPTAAPRSTWTSSDADTAPNRRIRGRHQRTPAAGAGSGAVTNPPATLPPTLPQGVRPLPSVDGAAPGSFPQPPPLLNSPRDHTATIRPIPTQWASSPIAWPERLAQHTVDVKTTEDSTTDPAGHRTAARDATVRIPAATIRLGLEYFARLGPERVAICAAKPLNR